MKGQNESQFFASVELDSTEGRGIEKQKERSKRKDEEKKKKKKIAALSYF